MKITIRQVDAIEEHDLLLDLQHEVMPEDPPVRPEDALQWWIAYNGEAPAGFAALSKSRQTAGRGYLSAAGVLKGYRGLGIQKRLIRARIAYARRAGMVDLVTDTAPWNPASANSLIACGFRMFNPVYTWKVSGTCYWRKPL